MDNVRGVSLFNLHRRERDAVAGKGNGNGNATPVVMADSFIAIHSYEEDGKEGALLYLSPIAYGATSPTFNNIVMPGSAISLVVIKLYIKEFKGWSLLMVLKLDLSKLVVVSPESSTVKNHINSFIITDSAGLTYTFQKYLKASNHHHQHHQHHDNDVNARSYSRSLHPSKSYTFAQLRSLGHLVKSINEITATKGRLLKEINSFPKDHQDFLLSSEQLRFEIDLLQLDSKKLKQTNEKLASQIYNLNFKLKLIRHHTDSTMNHDTLFSVENELFDSQVSSITKNLEESVFPDTMVLLIDKFTQLNKIVPIEQNDVNGNFTILQLEFPSNTTSLLDICYNSQQWEKIEKVNVALTYIVRFMEQLATLICMRFKYPIKYIENQYFVSDVENKHYPLFYDLDKRRRRNVVRDLPFEQAISFLTKNLIILISKYIDLWNQYQTFHQSESVGHMNTPPPPPQLLRNIPFECLDNFLWSLKYLVLLVTAPSVTP
ncbi:uncharacterized protein KQ657_001500 [Scheffersomyces spartinae]|uniref:Uncharacterized protein n=1 Tax=Scheffersomyces spartinae TaxID=45513 RepID=A0A9P8AHN8_9ASCO|nr:uncharacterized protein KQ657_001500 [Scheffersomyces spartinae]KAG7192717.1 hypothetical protein KQ657_001500 [Scheffersomyces spartinae]